MKKNYKYGKICISGILILQLFLNQNYGIIKKVHANTSSKSIETNKGNYDIFNKDEKNRIEKISSTYNNIVNKTYEEYFDITPSNTHPYNAGKVKDSVLQNALNCINLFRYIARLDDNVILDNEYTSLTQHATVLLSATNKLTHTPEKPLDMDDTFYEIGYKGATSSNLAYSPTLLNGLMLYMDDSDTNNIDRVGHRRWILNPKMGKTGIGFDNSGYSAMYSFDTSNKDAEYDFVAWPAYGIMPTELFNSNQAWSVSVNSEIYGIPEKGKTKVILKRISDSKVWSFYYISQNNNEKNYYNIDTAGYGISNCIIFRPEMSELETYSHGDEFEVTIQGLRKPISYRVKFFDIIDSQL